MPRRTQSGKPVYQISASFKDPQLRRLNEKVDQKSGASELRAVVAQVQATSSIDIRDLASKVATLETAEGDIKSDEIVGNGGNLYDVDFDCTSDDPSSYDVSLNGLVLSPVSDYSVNSSENKITLAVSASAGDDIVITQRDGSSFSDQDAIDEFNNALYN